MRTLALALLGACAALAASAASAPNGAAAGMHALANSVTYEDSQGEDPNAPDITTVVISNNDAGQLVFQINIPNRPALASDMLLLIFLDTDDNAATGEPDLGTDYAIQLLPGAVGLFRWDGTTYTSAGVPQTSLIFSYANGATIRLSTAELGATQRFKFAVLVESGIVTDPTSGEPNFDNTHRDVAPDPGHGLYTYDVKLAPLTLVVKKFKTVPVKPKAGRPFTVVLVAARSDTGALIQAGDVTCTATVAFKPIELRTLKAVGGRSSCTWLIPKGTAGKTIRGSIELIFEDLTAKKSFSGKIA